MPFFFFVDKEPLCLYSWQSKKKLVSGLGFFVSLLIRQREIFVLCGQIYVQYGIVETTISRTPFKKLCFSFAIKAYTAGGL